MVLGIYATSMCNSFQKNEKNMINLKLRILHTSPNKLKEEEIGH